ncbi:MAG: site-2 protease family protein [bacterium]|nr:site-2 protease family protein [bacterium]
MESLLLPIFYIVVILYSVTIHEVSHGLMANSLGDNTAKNLGRLSLNPIKHIDLFGSVLLPLFLFFTTGFVFGYAKPVPYNPNNLVDKKFGPAKVAIAGPLSNFILALLFGLSLRFMPDLFISPLIPQLFSYIVLLNLVLGIFNMFPVPPLDGHWLLMTFLPPSMNSLKVYIYRNSFILFPIFLIIFIVFVSPVIYWLFRLITGVGLQ